MRILIIWAESINRHTGGTIHLSGWCHGLKTLGHEIKIIAPCYGRSKSSQIENVSHIRLPRRCFASFLLLQIITAVCLPYWILKYHPEIIFIRTCFLAFLMALICKLARIPINAEVGTVVDAEVTMRGESRVLTCLIRIIDRLNYRFVNGITTVTTGAREEFIRRGANPDTTVVIHNAARVDIMQPMNQKQARRQLELAEEGYLVGYSGSFAPWQGLDLLVQAAQKLIANSGQIVHFVLAGDGKCRKELQQTIEELDLNEYFTFLGLVPFEQIVFFNNACDLTAIPVHDSRRIQYGLDPLKFWDSISCGVPVLVPEGSQLEAILEHLRLPGTFRAGDTKDLAEKILQVLSNTEDHQARRVDVHRIVSEQYSWTHVAEKLIEHCRRIGVKTK
jgi:glycosyltransferase involved in cell wall biosynthesis